MKIYYFVVLIAICTVGCANKPQVLISDASLHQPFSVIFNQRQDQEFGYQAFYVIRNRADGSLIGKVPSIIKADERGVDNRRLIVKKDFNPLALTSETGNTILITEDCWDAIPANTYLLIRLSDRKVVESHYIAIPSNRKREGAYPTTATVAKLDDRTVTVSYGNTKKTFDLKKLDRLDIKIPTKANPL